MLASTLPVEDALGYQVCAFPFRGLMRIIDSKRGTQVTLDILVEALGRVNFGCGWDYKGLTSPDVKLNGELGPSTVVMTDLLCMHAVLAGHLLPLTTLKQCCSCQSPDHHGSVHWEITLQ